MRPANKTHILCAKELLMAKRILLGIDLGTTMLKVCAFDARTGVILAQAAHRLRVRVFPNGGREQNLALFDRTFRSVVGKLREQLGTAWRTVEGIGIAAQGGSSIIADRIGLKLADYHITESGFGADIGFEKFWNLKCRYSGLKPNCAVVVATIRALKCHGGAPIPVPGKPMPKEYEGENVAWVEEGCKNLIHHIETVKKAGINPVVCINAFYTDTDNEIAAVRRLAEGAGARVALSRHWEHGGDGALEFADAVVDACEEPNDFKFLYDKRLSSYGYGWVIPKKKGLVAGVGCLLSQMNHPSQIRKNLAWMLGREAIEALEYPRIGLVPFMGPINKTCAGTMLKVGDAAGFASPFSGEGLYYGLKSASIASDVISDYLEFGTSLNEYERAWRESFGQILLLNRLAAKVLYGNRFMLKYLIKKIEGNQKITSLLNKHMSKQEITPINYVQSIPHILGV